MATSTEIQDLISKVAKGQFVVLKKTSTSTDFKTSIVDITDGEVKRTTYENWSEGWPNEPEWPVDTVIYCLDGSSYTKDLSGELKSSTFYEFMESKEISSITNIIIGYHVTSIANGSFYINNCSLLSSVSIPDSVTSIGCQAFERCKNLVYINIPDSVSSIEYQAFSECSKLSSINIPNSITIINNALFTGTQLTSVSIPDSVTSIGQAAFFNTLLTSVSIPDSVTSIGDSAFGGGNSSIIIYTTKQSVANLICESTIGRLTDPTKIAYIYLNNSLYKTIYHTWSCFPVGTKITLADNSKKNIEDITYKDVLKVFDFDEGHDTSASICWLTQHGLSNDHYYQLTFSDGTILKTTGTNSNHKIYNVDERYFKGVDKTQVGDRVYSENGVVTVTDKQLISAEVEYYNLITSKKINCYAEGILASDRYGNLYPIDEDMKYVKEGRTVRPYSELSAAGISEYWYDNLRLGESTDDLSTMVNYIAKCESQMRPLSSED